MPYTREEVLEGILHAAITRAMEAQEEDGGIDEDTQDEVDRIASMANPDQLDQLVSELNAQERLSLDPDRSATDSASRLVDDIISKGATAGVVIADEIRRKVRALAKKKFPSQK